MFFLPLLSDLLLIDHHRVRLLLEGLISFFHLNHDRLQMSHFLISIILNLVESVVLVDFAFLTLRDSLVFFISQLVGQVPQPLIFVKQAFIVLHIAVKLDFLLMKFDLCLLVLL